MAILRFNSPFQRAAVILLVASSLQAQYQWTCRYPNLGYPPYDGRPWEGTHSVKYFSSIPVDHINGPSASPCFNVPAGLVTKKYKGDPNSVIWGYPPQSWRTSSFFSFRITDGISGPFWRDPMPTRNYGYGSPINGSTLSGLDEDNVRYDCFVWNDVGTADNSSWQYEYTTPSSTQGHVRFYGTGSNPLESPASRIAWDMRTIVDISNLDDIRAKVNYNHTCYPAHAISVNNYVIYHYTPSRHDELYLINCLVLQQDKLVGEQQSTTRVPCN